MASDVKRSVILLLFLSLLLWGVVYQVTHTSRTENVVKINTKTCIAILKKCGGNSKVSVEEYCRAHTKKHKHLKKLWKSCFKRRFR